MNRLIRFFVCVISSSVAAVSALAQTASFAGTWTVDVEGSNRQRTAIVSQTEGRPRVSYGWKEPGAKIGPVESSIDPAGALTWTTNADAVFVVKLVDENTMRGQLTTREGKVMTATLTRATMAAAANDVAPVNGTVTGAATSASPAFLDKAAIESLVIGHKLTFVRHDDKNAVLWAVDRNGTVYGDNLTRGSKDTARWTLNDKGELCLKWKGNSNDGCRLFSTVDGKTVMFDTRSPAVVNATVEKID